MDPARTALRLVRPPVAPADYSRVGDAVLRLAELAANYHRAQTPSPPSPPSPPPHRRPTLRLVGAEGPVPRKERA